MNNVPLAVQAPKAFLEIDIPLHAYTDSDTHVAQLVETLLNDIASTDDEVTHADVLQALAITTVVRTAIADMAEQGGAKHSLALLDVAVEPANRRVLHVA